MVILFWMGLLMSMGVIVFAVKNGKSIVGVSLIAVACVIACAFVGDISRERVPFAMVSWLSGVLLGLASWCLSSMYAAVPSKVRIIAGALLILAVVALRAPFMLGWWK